MGNYTLGHLLGIFKKFFLKNRSNPGKRELTLIYPALWAKPCGGHITFLNSPNTEDTLMLNIYLPTVLSISSLIYENGNTEYHLFCRVIQRIKMTKNVSMLSTLSGITLYA